MQTAAALRQISPAPFQVGDEVEFLQTIVVVKQAVIVNVNPNPACPFYHIEIDNGLHELRVSPAELRQRRS